MIEASPVAVEAGGRAAAVAQLRDVRLRYGKTTALDSVSLDIPAGCIVGLIGPDGVGKSSLLSLIAGLHKASRLSGQLLTRSLRLVHPKIRWTSSPKRACMRLTQTEKPRHRHRLASSRA
jgi:ABC-type branched-subunit amino acid transport system ATPase component